MKGEFEINAAIFDYISFSKELYPDGMIFPDLQYSSSSMNHYLVAVCCDQVTFKDLKTCRANRLLQEEFIKLRNLFPSIYI